MKKLQRAIPLFNILLLLAISGCSNRSSERSSAFAYSSSSYAYPTSIEQEVVSICNRMYDPQFAPLLLETRKSTISKILIVREGVVGYFRNGGKVVLPIATRLPLGESYSCGPRVKHYPCLSERSLDPNCSRNRPYR